MKVILKNIFILSLLAALLLLFNFLPSLAEAGNGDFAGGDGSADDPFQVATAEQLDNVRDYLNAHFIQVDDIDLRDFLNPGDGGFINDGAGWEPIGNESNPFSGKFDGDGYTILGLFIDRGTNYIGLFGYTNRNSVITGVKLQEDPVTLPDIKGNNYVGSLVGHNEGLISQCSAQMRVEGKNHVGGLVGYNQNYSNPDLECIIEKSFFLGDVTGEKRVGGLVGGNYGWAYIENCYVKGGFVTAEDYFGGLVGENIHSRIYKSFVMCGLTQLGDDFFGNHGGLVGYNEDSGGPFGVHQSYYNRQAAEMNDTGKGEPRTTAEMTYPYLPQDEVYEDWDFNAVWVEDKDNNNHGYPYLKWFGDAFDSGYGTASNPFQVATADQLDRVRDYPDAHFIQTANIDLNRSPYNEGEGWEPIGIIFTGSYDGDDWTIRNLFINRSNDNVGLFRATGDDAMISNLHLDNVDVTGGSNVGSLVGNKYGGIITSCSVTRGDVRGNYNIGGLVGANSYFIKSSYARVSVESNVEAGGLVGLNSQNGIISDHSYATGSVTGSRSLGGLVGVNIGMIDFCYATGSVEGSGDYIGGLVGRNTDNSIKNSRATGSVKGDKYVGGLVGTNLSEIINSYATGEVMGSSYVAGLVGSNGINSSIVNTYATGLVKGKENMGGLVGQNGGGDDSIIYSYYDAEKTNQTDTGKGIPKSTNDMLTGIPSPEIYTGWAIDDWKFIGGEYPQIRTSLNSAYLLNLKVDPGELTPAFNSFREGYTVDVAHNIDSVDVEAWRHNRLNPAATIFIDGSLANSGVARTVNLEAPGTITEIEVVVYSADWMTWKTYTININRLGSDQTFIDVPIAHPFFDEIEALAVSGISTGWEEEDGTFTFRPSLPVTRQAMAAFLARGLELDKDYAVPAEPTFSDVPLGHPFFNQIELLAASGISTGWEENDGTFTFRPSANVTRQAMAAFLTRGLELEVPDVAEPSFADVPENHPFFDEIEALAAEGISTGWEEDDGTFTFRPSANVTRQAMAAFLVRGLDLDNP